MRHFRGDMKRADAKVIAGNSPFNLPKPNRAPRSPLTAVQVEFVDHYLRYRNATQAYKFASGRDDIGYSYAAVEGQKLLRDARVQAAIRAGAHTAFADTAASVGWLLQRFLDIATADPRELIGLKIGCCRFCHGDGYGYQWREREFIEACDKVDRDNRQRKGGEPEQWPDIAGGFGFNATYAPVDDCPQCHGEGVERFVPRDTDRLSDQALLLYGGLKVKQGGYEIIIADRAKALEMVGKIMGAFTENVAHSGAIGALVAIDDLRKADPIASARTYQEMIKGHLTLAG